MRDSTDIFYACRGHLETCGLQLEVPSNAQCNPLQSGYQTFRYTGTTPFAGKQSSDFYYLGGATTESTGTYLQPITHTVASNSGAIWWAQAGQPAQLQILNGSRPRSHSPFRTLSAAISTVSRWCFTTIFSARGVPTAAAWAT